jgi:Zn finger protein HypA/HybF involved in hydrogenase expression/predicted nucleic acid-binding Zn ribbon protein
MRFADISKEKLEEVILDSTSIAEVLDKLQYSKCSTAYATFHKTCGLLGIKYSHFSLGLAGNRGKKSNRKITKEQLLERMTENSRYAPDKQKLIEYNLLSQNCYGESCTIVDAWLGKSITLQLDHINGINTDNRLQNLRLLCPNCHSQTETFSGRNSKKPQSLCVDCSTPISKKSTRCGSCSAKIVNGKRKKVMVSARKLAILLTNHTYVELGKMFGVSDTAIRKLAKKYGIGK